MIEVGKSVIFTFFNANSQRNERAMGQVLSIDGEQARIKFYGYTLIKTVPVADIEQVLDKKPRWA